MSRLPFTTYDFFAYITSGSVVFSAADYIYGNQWLLYKEHSAVFTLVLIFWIYLIGHLVAIFSSLILEALVVGQVLGRPSTILMHINDRKLKWLFPQYFQSLPIKTRERITERSKERGFSGDTEALFLHIFSIVKNIEPTKERLDDFRNLYGFARNTSFAFFIVSIMMFIGPIDEREIISLGWLAAIALASIAMFYRYLKFFRQYSYEMFVTYSELSR